MKEFLFFEVKKEHLPTTPNMALGFNLFAYKKNLDIYSFVIGSNTPINEDFHYLIKRITNDSTQQLAVRTSQKMAFLQSAGLKEEDVPSLHSNSIHPLLDKKIFREKKYLQLKSLGTYDINNLKQVYNVGLSTQNFKELINIVQDEILIFNLDVNETTTLAVILAEHLLKEDTITSRIVALVYLFIKMKNITDQITISNIIVAAFLHHVGLTQFKRSFHQPYSPTLPLGQIKALGQHIFITEKLIKKYKLNLTQECLRIIQEHHEYLNGSGTPSQLKGNSISPHALLLGIASEICHHFSFNLNEDSQGNEIAQKVIQLIDTHKFMDRFGADFTRLLRDLHKSLEGE